mgnify:CR=1 FL=1
MVLLTGTYANNKIQKNKRMILSEQDTAKRVIILVSNTSHTPATRHTSNREVRQPPKELYDDTTTTYLKKNPFALEWPLVLSKQQCSAGSPQWKWGESDLCATFPPVRVPDAWIRAKG